jgi:hypothetical protein
MMMIIRISEDKPHLKCENKRGGVFLEKDWKYIQKHFDFHAAYVLDWSVVQHQHQYFMIIAWLKKGICVYCIRLFTHALMGKQYWKVNVNFQLVFHSWDEIEIYFFFSLASFLSVLFYFLLFSLALFIFTSTPPLPLRNFPRLCIDE